MDIVPNDYSDGKYIITYVHNRLNFIPRPTIANLKRLIMVIAPKPEPDLYLIDKLYIYCVINNIEPILVINKCDIATDDLVTDLQRQYYFMKIFVVGANR